MSTPDGLTFASVKNSGIFVTSHESPRSSGNIAFATSITPSDCLD